jgi:hypothetical protein
MYGASGTYFGLSERSPAENASRSVSHLQMVSKRRSWPDATLVMNLRRSIALRKATRSASVSAASESRGNSGSPQHLMLVLFFSIICVANSTV